MAILETWRCRNFNILCYTFCTLCNTWFFLTWVARKIKVFRKCERKKRAQEQTSGLNNIFNTDLLDFSPKWLIDFWKITNSQNRWNYTLHTNYKQNFWGIHLNYQASGPEWRKCIFHFLKCQFPKMYTFCFFPSHTFFPSVLASIADQTLPFSRACFLSCQSSDLKLRPSPTF